MEDAIRPNEQAFKAMYERGYCTWFSLYEMTVADTETNLPWWDCLPSLRDAFLNYPTFPENLAVDASFSNTVLAKGISTWRTAQRPCGLNSFEQEFFIPVASDGPVILAISDTPPFAFPRCIGEDEDHITLLILAWTYVLSDRWAEIIPGASGPRYSNYKADWDNDDIPFGNVTTRSTTAIIDLGGIDDDARWWAAVLAVEGGWSASIQNDKDGTLYSPWSTKFVSEQHFTLSRGTKSQPFSSQHRPASFAAALNYLSSYCELHKVAEQCQAALAATLLLPMARYDNRRVQLPTPRVRRKVRLNGEQVHTTSIWSDNLKQLDRLLTLSCNAVGTKALLNSVFFEAGVACNICGAWLQGTFAFLDSEIVQDKHILLSVLLKRDPSLGFLWLGAFIVGVYERSLQEARQAWWKVDLHVAAWTGTLMSFIQEPVSAMGRHCLEYEGLTWRCRGGQHVTITLARTFLRAKNGHPGEGNICIAYDNLDREDDDCSEMVTRNIFTWLRDEDGFPVAERTIREHEWIGDLDSGDDCLITGDAKSSYGGNLHGWLLKTMTRRSNSLC
ncbi:hypothetical protein PVAG01_09739 [Phlyctema vagabunda]|uniref:Uncharacterized protein n=1 Tax=Phlyctema vagabunda TaxID=108571 RepID=A0ABR4P8D4_9HELO